MTLCELNNHVFCVEPGCVCACHPTPEDRDRRGYGRRWSDVRAEAVEKGLIAPTPDPRALSFVQAGIDTFPDVDDLGGLPV